MKIISNTVGTTIPKPDWEQTDPKKGDYIKNKPVVLDGEDGATFTPSVDSSGNLSWTNDKELKNPAPVNIKGATFTPSVDEGCNLSWTNDKGLSNPGTVNIKGDTGYTPVKGTDYYTESDKNEMVGKVLGSIPRVTNVSTVQNKNVTTMTLTMNNGDKSNIEIEYNSNGDPSKITVDGEEISLEFFYNSTYLFNKGDKCTTLTGGWEAVDYLQQGYYGLVPTLSFSGSTMTAEFTPNRESVGQVRTKNAINLSGKSKLVFRITKVTDPASSCQVGVMDESGNNIVMTKSAKASVGVVEIDLSGVSGTHRVGILLKSSSGNALVSVESIELV